MIGTPRKPKSGKDRLAAVIEKQKLKTLEMINLVVKHQGDIMHGENPTLTPEEIDSYEREFKDGLIDKMMNDPAEFRYIIEMYVEDLKSGRVKDKKPSEERLREFGAIGVSGKILGSAGQRIASGMRRGGGGISKKDLGLYKKIFNAPGDDAGPSPAKSDDFVGKAVEKINALGELFKESIERTGQEPVFDVKQFREDKEYREEMLEYLKDISKSNKELTKDQKELLAEAKKEESRQKFVEGARERMTPGQQIVYDVTKSAARAVSNLGKNLFGKKKEQTAPVSDVIPPVEPVSPIDSDLPDTQVDKLGLGIETPVTHEGFIQLDEDETPVTHEGFIPLEEDETKGREFNLGLKASYPIPEQSPQRELSPKNDIALNAVESNILAQRPNIDEITQTAVLNEEESDDKRADENLETLKHIDENIEKLVEKTGEQVAGGSPRLGEFENGPDKDGMSLGSLLAGGYASVQGIRNTSTLFDSDADVLDKVNAAGHLAVSGIGGLLGRTAGAILPGISSMEGAAYGAAAGEGLMSIANWTGEKLGGKTFDLFGEVEPIPADTIGPLSETSETAAEVKKTQDATLVGQVAGQTAANLNTINAPTNNSPVTLMGGSASPHFKQNPRNPDNSLKSWLNTRVAYV